MMIILYLCLRTKLSKEEVPLISIPWFYFNLVAIKETFINSHNSINKLNNLVFLASFMPPLMWLL
jgi:hypothetical protein